MWEQTGPVAGAEVVRESMVLPFLTLVDRSQVTPTSSVSVASLPPYRCQKAKHAPFGGRGVRTQPSKQWLQ
jgi:hypothetical protein